MTEPSPVADATTTTPGAPSVSDNEDARSVAGSERSTASSRSGIPKFAGSKLPTAGKVPTASGVATPSASRIGRPCTVTGSSAKAPLPPATPQNKKMSSYDYVRRVSDEMNRFKLSDTQDLFKDDFYKDYTNANSYASNYSKPPKGLGRERSHSRERSRERSPSLRRTSLGSTGTASSMDALWELHPRRLSEAGLSRYSDNSTVLTEDTNSFIIGQRVFVGGSKPGQIAYIGETQFAPGEWAGIVLDQPIGKNDGSVGGTRYFQCEAKRGVFSRLTRLTRYPLGPDAAGGDASYCASPSPTNGVRKSPMSPTTSTRSALSISNTSLASAHVDYKLGDRVIIKSSQGSKVGTLKYMGFTSFANGEWCGVELDEPRGKNDGSVAGERYFDCRPNYGLFAPVGKVSRSPSNRKPGNCVVHSSMRRGNSKESLMSLNSSLASASVVSAAARRVRLGVTSLTPKKSQSPPKANSTPFPSRTALQDVLKEKQQHIEQLLKERDLERAEITKAASLTDEIEQKYVSLQKEFENYRLDSDRVFKEHANKLGHFEAENKELLGQLDEEKQRNEDWQFKFEEAAITKADVESLNEEHVAKITELQLQIAAYTSQIDDESALLAKAREEMIALKEENESVKVELAHATEKRSSLENEETKSIELVQTLQSQVDDANSALKQQQEIATRQIEELNKQITKINSEHEVTVFKLNQDVEELRAKYTNDLHNKNEEVKLLTCNYEETKNMLENAQKDIEKYKYDANVTEQGMKKELDKLKMEISAKVLEMESQTDLVKTQSQDLKKLEEALSKTQIDLETQIKETDNVNMEEEKSMIEVSKLKELLAEANSNVAKQQEEIQKEIDTGKKENEHWNAKYSELNTQLEVLKQELTTKSEEFQGLSKKFKETEDELAKSSQRLEKGKTEFAQLQEKLQLELQNVEKAKTKESDLVLQLGDAQRNAQQNEEKLLKADKVKEKLTGEIQQLIGVSGEDSGKLDILNKALQSKEKELEHIRGQFDLKIKELEHSLQEATLKLTNTVEKTKGEKQELETIILALQAEVNETGENSEKSLEILNKNVAELKQELDNAKQHIIEKEKSLEKLKQDLQLEQQAKIEFETKLGENQQTNNEMVLRIEEMKKEVANLQENALNSNEQLLIASNSLNTQSSESKQQFETLQQEFALHEDHLQATINEKEATVQELLQRIEEIEKQNSQKDASATEKDLEITTLKQQHIELKKHAEELRLDCENNQQLLVNSQQEISKFSEKYNELNNKLTETEHELQEAHKTETVILEKNNKITLLDNKLAELHKTINSITSQLDNSKGLEAEQQKRLEEYQEKVQKLEASLLSKEQEGKDVNSNLLGKNEEIAKLQNDLQHILGEKQQQDKVSVTLQEELTVLRSKQEMQVEELAKLAGKYTLCEDVLKNVQVTEECKAGLLKRTQEEKEEHFKNIIQNLPVLIVNDNKTKVQELEMMINTNNECLVSANSKIKQQQNEVSLLQQELLRVKLDNANKQPTSVQVTDETLNNNSNTNTNLAYKQLLEEKLQVEGQVEFLHSIIADMQKKNEEQKARIEILESGYSPAAADEFKLMGLIDKKITPRMYCDICEEFDLHETEDCPTQADEDMPPPPPPGGKKKEKAPPRPYCEICEVFGHATDDCTEEETY